MNIYAVESVLTFNAADFKRYSNITALHPYRSARLDLRVGPFRQMRPRLRENMVGAVGFEPTTSTV